MQLPYQQPRHWALLLWVPSRAGRSRRHAFPCYFCHMLDLIGLQVLEQLLLSQRDTNNVASAELARQREELKQYRIALASKGHVTTAQVCPQKLAFAPSSLLASLHPMRQSGHTSWDLLRSLFALSALPCVHTTNVCCSHTYHNHHSLHNFPIHAPRYAPCVWLKSLSSML